MLQEERAGRLRLEAELKMHELRARTALDVQVRDLARFGGQSCIRTKTRTGLGSRPGQ